MPAHPSLVSWPSALCLPRARRAPRQLHTWRSRSAPSFARTSEGQHSHLPSVGTESTPPGPTNGPVSPGPTLVKGSVRGPARAAPPPLPRPSSRSRHDLHSRTCPLEGLDGLVPRDGGVIFSETSETKLLLSRECAPPRRSRRAGPCSLRSVA